MSDADLVAEPPTHADSALRRRLGWVFVVVGGLIVLGGIWIAVTGFLARGQLEAARSDVAELRTQVTAGNLDAARTTSADLAGHAHRAAFLTSGPAWWVAANLPGGEPIGTARTITVQLDTISQDVLPQIVDTTRQLDPATLRRPDGSFDLDRIAATQPVLDHATQVMAAATRAVGDQPAHTWLGPIDRARADLLTRLASLQKTLRSADLAADVAPHMLGQDGEQRYFVAFQNSAESRGTGGLPGAFAIVTADKGRIRFERYGSDEFLLQKGLIDTHLDFGTGFQNLYGAGNPTKFYLDSNMSPNFPYAGQIWARMWEKRTGEHIDGALAVDPTALSYLLAVTGPTKLPDGTPISAGNVVSFTQRTVYQRFPEPSQSAERQHLLLAAAQAATTQIFDAHTDAKALLLAAGRAEGERRLLLWSDSSSIESQLKQTALGGAVPQTGRPYVGPYVVNLAGNKLDYYLDRSFTWTRTGCGPTRDITASFRLTNDAPSNLPDYVVGIGVHSGRGNNRLLVYYDAGSGAQLQSSAIDGRTARPYVGSDLGHTIYALELALPRGATRTVTFHVRAPAGTGAPLVLRQPLVRPLQLSLRDQRCG